MIARAVVSVWQGSRGQVIHRALVLTFTLLCTGALAQANTANDGVHSLLAQAEQAALHRHPTWHKLVYYQPNRFGRGYSSDINSAGFFLAAEGEYDPQVELETLIRGVTAPVDPEKPEQHAQCRFPARFTWLQEQLDFSHISLPEPECLNYMAWRVNESIDSVSLIWANGYLGNPSSFYGHVLLKLNYATSDPDSILGTTVNFGVDLPNDETPALFVWRGLVGSYNAVFSYSRFYQNSLLYGEFQQRDLWEYRLNLPQDKVDFIVAHTWELLGQEFVYYFSRQNCAFRTAQVLDLVLEEALGNKIKPWMLPHDIFNNIMAQEIDGEPLVDKVSYIPSGQSRFTTLFDELSREQRRYIGRHIAAPIDAKPVVNGFSEAEQIDVIDALLEYYGFYYSLNGTQEESRRVRRDLLVQRLPLAESPERQWLTTQQPPTAGQIPSLLQLAPFYNETLGAGAIGRFRLSYFDHLAPSQGRLPFMHMAMVDVNVAATEDALWLRRFDLIHIEALNVSHTGLPGDGGLAWKVRMGAEAADLSCTDCTQFFAEGGSGKAWKIGSDSAVFGLLEGRLASGDKGILSGTARTGAVLGLHPLWKAHLDLGYRYHLDDSVDAEPMLALRSRFGAGRRWDVTLSAEEHVAREYRVAFSAHW
ncbi:DUF4105 domain-containing protein [Salinispirillum sp. LH 10-3-1]|uniref:DUF4105 domain-containing protein n=1 Tax=Salinispirillum sp. LH 10-3-1 TaxID=2952525 RepID=A0AB38YBP7_9GAMM